MKKYDIFKSEGGYRVCLGLWGDNPVIKVCPWFEDEIEAMCAAKKFKFEDSSRDVAIFDHHDGSVAVQIGQELRETKSLDEAKKVAIEAIKKRGYSEKYILEHRPDLRAESKDDLLSKLENMAHLASDFESEWFALGAKEKQWAKEFDHEAMAYSCGDRSPDAPDTWPEFYLDDFFLTCGGCSDQMISAIAEKSESSWAKAFLAGEISCDRLREIAALANTVADLEARVRRLTRKQ